jgi:hypothetical protein
MAQHDNLINGEWLAGASYSANTNPSNLAGSGAKFGLR